MLVGQHTLCFSRREEKDRARNAKVLIFHIFVFLCSTCSSVVNDARPRARYILKLYWNDVPFQVLCVKRLLDDSHFFFKGEHKFLEH